MLNPSFASGQFCQYKMVQKTWKINETLACGYSSDSAQWELSNKYQHDRVKMVFKILCIIVLWMKVALALEGLLYEFLYYRLSSRSMILFTVTWELRTILQNIWSRVVDNVLVNISPSNIFLTRLSPKNIHQYCLAAPSCIQHKWVV